MRWRARVRKVALESSYRQTPGYTRPMATRPSQLRRTRDIRSVLATGDVAHGRTMVIHARDRHDDGPARWTTVAGRKVGKAVVRNRAKRRLRTVVGETALPPGRDLVVVARRAVIARPIDELRKEFRDLVARVAGDKVSQGGDGG